MLSCFDFIRDSTLTAMLLRLLLAFVCGGVIGAEREFKRRPAGFRTHILICLGAAVTEPVSFPRTGTVHGRRAARRAGHRRHRLHRRGHDHRHGQEAGQGNDPPPDAGTGLCRSQAVAREGAGGSLRVPRAHLHRADGRCPAGHDHWGERTCIR